MKIICLPMQPSCSRVLQLVHSQQSKLFADKARCFTLRLLEGSHRNHRISQGANMDEQSDNDAIRVMQQRQQRQQKQEQSNDEHSQPENHEEERPTHYVPLWSNLDLPNQDSSIVAHAAHVLQSKCVAVPENPALAPTKRRLEHAKDAYRVPCESVTVAVYEAFTAMSTVVVCISCPMIVESEVFFSI